MLLAVMVLMVVVHGHLLPVFGAIWANFSLSNASKNACTQSQITHMSQWTCVVLWLNGEYCSGSGQSSRLSRSVLFWRELFMEERLCVVARHNA